MSGHFSVALGNVTVPFPIHQSCLAPNLENGLPEEGSAQELWQPDDAELPSDIRDAGKSCKYDNTTVTMRQPQHDGTIPFYAGFISR
jgi:hypothetical protein